MFKRTLVSIGIAGALAVLAGPIAAAGPTVRNHAVEIVGVGAVADPLVAVEANRAALVQRLVGQYREAAFVHGVAETTFYNALMALRADQLLAAALVSSFEEVSAIVAQAPLDGMALQRFVALTPITPLSMSEVPLAEAYLVREHDTLSVVRANKLPLGEAGLKVVGYFVPATTATVVTTVPERVMPKDGSGSGANSWIGYVAGNNLATGTGSAVTAGTFNWASNLNSFVGAGQSNRASGISSLVFGGFDNWATAIDSVVIGGAGHRATGARSFIGGGGYNVASGQWSAIVGGGRDGVVNTPAGTSNLDQIASGDFSFVGGGQGNRATGDYSVVVGGYLNIASGDAAVVAGGNNGVPSQGNVASGNNSFIGSGFLNVASGSYSVVPGGFNNIASGGGSVAMGVGAVTQTITPTVHDGTFVFSDGSNGNFRSFGNRTFNVLATGGVRFATAATNPSGEAIVSRYVDILPAGAISFEGSDTTKIVLDDNTAGRNIGVQPNTVYHRTNGTIAWYLGGIESAVDLDAGSGGSVLATLTSGATGTTVTGTFRAVAFAATSDRNQKTAFAALSPKAILAKVASLPIKTWSYITESGAGIRHIGPTAQDFKRLFNVGYDDKSIATVDADGVALAAIQGLKQELDERSTKFKQELDEKNARIDRLERELDAMKAKLGLK